MYPPYFIDPKWINEIKGKPFYYPCAGNDLDEPIQIFGKISSELWFCDPFYPRGLKIDRAIKSGNNLNIKFLSSRIDGNAEAVMENRNGYRFIEPSRKYEEYEYEGGKKVTIIRRRGFGQIGLYEEFADNSLGIFMHRGDSQGDGGSNVYFFKNFKSNYAKIGNLANLVARKINKRALIISDGSNSPKGHYIRKYHNKNNINGADAYKNLFGKNYKRDGLLWECVGYLGRKYGPTLVWGVSKI